MPPSPSIARKIYNRLWKLLPREWRFKRVYKQIADDHEKRLRAARAANDRNLIDAVEWDAHTSLMIEDEVHDDDLTQELLMRARAMRIPIPERGSANESSEYWQEGHYVAKWVLTAKGVAALRRDIREEVKARREMRSHWIAWATAITGLVGACTGLAATLSHCAAQTAEHHEAQK